MRFKLKVIDGGTIVFGNRWLNRNICTFDSELKAGITYTAYIKAAKRLIRTDIHDEESRDCWVMDGHKKPESQNAITEIIFTDIREE